MKSKIRYGIRNILLCALWVSIGTGVLVLLVAGVRRNDAKRCGGIEISIIGVNNNCFLDKKDVLHSISEQNNGNPVGQATGSVNLRRIESVLEKNVWVRSANLYFDNNAILQVSINEREPLARVFTTGGATFYIDRDEMMLPLSEKFSARLPVFTDFPPGNALLSKADSSLLGDICTLSEAIQKDSFCMAMIEQVDITPQGNFEMMPKIGNTVIVFGDARSVNEKLDKLKMFYREVMVKAGWDHYSVIDLRFRGQVVARRRDAGDIAADSLRTLLLMRQIAANAERQASDSLQTIRPDNDRNTVDSNMVQQSIQRDETPAVWGKPVKTNADAPDAKPVTGEPKPVGAKPGMEKATVRLVKGNQTITNKRNDY